MHRNDVPKRLGEAVRGAQTAEIGADTALRKRRAAKKASAKKTASKAGIRTAPAKNPQHGKVRVQEGRSKDVAHAL
jgi:hypothetical protein